MKNMTPKISRPIRPPMTWPTSDGPQISGWLRLLWPTTQSDPRCWRGSKGAAAGSAVVRGLGRVGLRHAQVVMQATATRMTMPGKSPRAWKTEGIARTPRPISDGGRSARAHVSLVCCRARRQVDRALWRTHASS